MIVFPASRQKLIIVKNAFSPLVYKIAQLNYLIFYYYLIAMLVG